jgi:S-adenosylmethionine hydrolase
MPLRGNFNYVSIKITAVVQNGELTVELFDPKGDKYGSFSIAGLIRTENKNENQFIRGKIFTSDASGNLLRTIRNPMIGQWKAKVSTKSAVGVINFQFTSEVTVYKIE